MLDHSGGFASVARHPEQGIDCRLCERGGAELCVDCLCRGVLDARSEQGSPYAGPTPEQFEAQELRAAASIEQVAALRVEVGVDGVGSPYDRRPSQAGPSWCRLVGW